MKTQTVETYPNGARLLIQPAHKGVIYYRRKGERGVGISTRTRSLDEAREWVRRLELTQAIHKHHMAKKIQTFGEVLDAYLQDLRDQGKSLGQEYGTRALRAYFGNEPCETINAEAAAQYRQWRMRGSSGQSRLSTVRRAKGQGIKASTMRREMGALQAILRWGVENDKLAPDKTKVNFKKGKPGPARDVFLLDHEINDMMQRAAETSYGQDRLTRIHRFVWVSLRTGARLGAVSQLRWSQVDFDHRLIDFLPKGEVQKDNKKKPTVPIHDDLMPLLIQAKQEAIGPFVCDQTTKSGTANIQAWLKFVATTPYEADRGLHIHDLRRSFFTMLVKNGMPLVDISLTYGISIQVLLKHYAKYVPEQAEKIRKAITPFKPFRVAA